MYRVVVGDWFPVQPKHISTGPLPFFGAFGNIETEDSAKLIVKVCQVYHNKGPDSWQPFTQEQINAYLLHCGRTEPFRFNRLMTDFVYDGHSFRVSEEAGWIVKDKEGKLYVTDQFILRCYMASPADGPPNLITGPVYDRYA